MPAQTKIFFNLLLEYFFRNQAKSHQRQIAITRRKMVMACLHQIHLNTTPALQKATEDFFFTKKPRRFSSFLALAS
jgi:hypothetical protein